MNEWLELALEVRMLEIEQNRLQNETNQIFNSILGQDTSELVLGEFSLRLEDLGIAKVTKNYFLSSPHENDPILAPSLVRNVPPEGRTRGPVYPEDQEGGSPSGPRNDPFEFFETQILLLEESLCEAFWRCFIGGDFNSKSPKCGEARLDRRGILVGEMVARNDLIVLNQGKKFMFRRGAWGSIIDLAIAAPHLN